MRLLFLDKEQVAAGWRKPELVVEPNDAASRDVKHISSLLEWTRLRRTNPEKRLGTLEKLTIAEWLRSAHLPAYGGTLGAVNYSGDHGAWGWMVSPRANISTNWPMRLERVSGFLAFPIL